MAGGSKAEGTADGCLSASPALSATEDTGISAGDNIPAKKDVEMAEVEHKQDVVAKTTAQGRTDKPVVPLGSPEDTANVFSRIYYCYCNKLLRQGSKKQLEKEDLWGISPIDEADHIYTIFKNCLAATKDEANPAGHLGKALWRAFLPRFMTSGFIKLVWCLVQFSGPLLLEALLANLESANVSYQMTLILATAMLVASSLEMVLNNVQFHMAFRVGMHVKAATIHLVYDKLTRLSMASKSKMGSGTIANLQSNDTMKLWMLPQFLHSLWAAPLQILVLMGLLIRVLGVLPTLAGALVTVGLIPTSGYISKALGKVRRKVVKMTDNRVKAVSEVVTGIKAIKLYAWEEPYNERLGDLREVELKQVARAAYLQGLNILTFSAGPILIAMAAFGVFAALGKPLTASIAFPALALFNLLRFPILLLPMQLNNLVNAKVAHKRLQEFLNLDESPGIEEHPTAGPGEVAVAVTDTASFTWAEDAEKPVLEDINLEVMAGKLLVVVGEVGSGKSSLLQSILGETIKINGRVAVCGSIAYTCQDPWIQNKTLKDNVLWGRVLDEQKYRETLRVCSLEQDLRVLPAGDETEIGEKGVNLSGGQKHRVALARAVYGMADVYLLDDPLSAVDAHVGSHLFTECICGMLANTTRILVTHQLQFLTMADTIAVMKDGRIQHVGSYEELMAEGVNFQQYSISTGQEEAKKEEAADVNPEDVIPEVEAVEGDGSEGEGKGLAEEAQAEETPDQPLARAVSSKPALEQSCSIGMEIKRKPSLRRAGSLVLEEGRAKGQVKIKLYLEYLGAWGPFFILPTVFLFTASSERALQQVQNWWLSVWSTDGLDYGGTDKYNDFHYVSIFFAIGIASLVCAILRIVVMVRGTVAASRKLHHQLLDKVLKLPMMFFDTQPTGRLINRFTKDVESMDVLLGPVIAAFLVCATSAAASVIVIAAVAPWFMASLPVLGVAYWYVQQVYIKGSRELKRLDSVAFSPIFNHFGETLTGLSTVRAFREADAFAAHNLALLNQSNRCWWPLQAANRWLGMRLESIGVLTAFLTAILTSVLVPVGAGLAGLALTSAMQMTGVLNFMVRQSAELEINMNAVERILEYEDEPEEAAAVIPGNRPPEAWPSRGVIEVDDLYVRYREELDPVLKGISFSTREFEKIGIAGRTGCGKSTLMMTLYRIVEPIRGSITIDGVNTSGIGLRDLRSSLALVPQDPVVFSGTIRSNLDPFTQYSDSDLWQALEQVSLKGVVEGMDKDVGLDSVISEGGGNLSVGQRQLLGLARALLRNAHILVLDEATSNIDNTTDNLIQTTIRTAFANCTVLTIAHRLHTIMHSDRIMVLDNGRLMEFDSPKKLLKNKNGLFYGLVDEASKKGMHRSKSQARVADLVASEAKRVMAMPSIRRDAK